MDSPEPTPWLQAATVVTGAFALMLLAWPLRKLPTAARTCTAAFLSGSLLALPWFVEPSPVLPRVVVTLACCGALAAKLIDFACSAAHWRSQRFRAWLAYLVNPAVLVHEDYRPARRPPPATASLLRGLLEVTCGATLLAWHQSHIDSLPFWLAHPIGLVAAYLLVFDGGFTTLTGACWMLGLPVREQSRHPIAASTPADFWRRYNREAGHFLKVRLYQPLTARMPAAWAATLVLLINGVLHEYLATVLVGRPTGHQLAFFLVQGVAVGATLKVRPSARWRPAAVALTLSFMIVSSALFFASVDRLFNWFGRA